jgi:hypothetical protein
MSAARRVVSVTAGILKTSTASFHPSDALLRTRRRAGRLGDVELVDRNDREPGLITQRLATVFSLINSCSAMTAATAYAYERGVAT